MRYAFKAGFIVFFGLLHGAGAEEKPTPPPQSAKQQVVMPSAEKIVLLVRSTLNTLNDAIQTGNFTVLRDMAAPGFREANSAARLSQLFSDISSKRIDLSAVAVITPQLTEVPTLDQQSGMLHLKGYFPGQPIQINFEMLYQAVNGRWRLFGLSVQPGPPTSSPASADAQPNTDVQPSAPSSSATKKKQ